MFLYSQEVTRILKCLGTESGTGFRIFPWIGGKIYEEETGIIWDFGIPVMSLARRLKAAERNRPR
jgi:hypothetical protein